MTMRTFKTLLATLLLLTFSSSCDEDSINKILGNGDTVSALKEALSIGAATASNELGKEDGYLKDSLVKIALPAEANTMFVIINKLQSSSAGKAVLSAAGISANLENTMTTLINRAAEDAAPKAVNVFKNAITNITISDGEGILFGADNAATTYLHNSTYSGLQAAFNPSITESLATVSFAGYNANEAWDAVTSQYNKLMDLKSSTAGSVAMTALKIADKETHTQISNMNSIETNLANYVTGKSLDGLFAKVAVKELDIRTNVAARTTDLLQNVFGRLDK